MIWLQNGQARATSAVKARRPAPRASRYRHGPGYVCPWIAAGAIDVDMNAKNGPADGARVLMRTLVQSGVTTLFANPGTTELHMVEAAEATPGLRSVLALFEGVVSGAADGYGRIAGRPAATLLHLGPCTRRRGGTSRSSTRRPSSGPSCSNASASPAPGVRWPATSAR